MKRNSIPIDGTLVTLPLPGRARPLDGFWVHASSRRVPLLLFVHGMGSNFYRSGFKKEIMRQARSHGFDVLTFNNRGHEQNVARERFTDCLVDIDAAIMFGKRQGYRQFVLVGHSTGCQKITYYQARRKRSDVKALVLAGLGDDLAIARRDLGARYGYWLRRARALVAAGRGETLLPSRCMGFSARRFLSVADPSALEAKLFDFSGPLAHFAGIRCPVLFIMGKREEYACLPVPDMCARLRAKSHARLFEALVIPGADHGFHGRESETVRAIYSWLKKTT